MDVLIKTLPVYLYMLLGFIGGRYLHITKESIGNLLIYFILPVVFFNAVATTKLTQATILIPVIFFVLCSLVCLIYLAIGRYVFRSNLGHILALGAGLASYTYFALPISTIIFPPEIANLVIIAGIGYIFFENTLGYFIVAKGHHTVQESFFRLLKLPSLWGIVLGVIVNVLQINLGPVYGTILTSFRGALTVLGLMIMGLGVSDVTLDRNVFHMRFIALLLSAKFLMWPLLMTIFITLDTYILRLYSPAIHSMFFFMALLPAAGNTIIYAIKFNNSPQKTALAVVTSIFFSLAIIMTWTYVIHW